MRGIKLYLKVLIMRTRG